MQCADLPQATAVSAVVECGATVPAVPRQIFVSTLCRRFVVIFNLRNLRRPHRTPFCDIFILKMSAANGSSSRPKVLVPEKVSPDGLRMLQASLDVDEKQGLGADELLKIIGDYEALIVRSETKVTKALLEAGKKLRVVARAGVGVDNVDLDAATKLGIIVVNSPQGNINAAAEHTIALLMSVARNVGAAALSVKNGKWERSKLVGVEVKGKTLSVLGLGKGMYTSSLL